MLFKSRHNYMTKQILFDMHKEIFCDTIKESSTSNIIKKKTHRDKKNTTYLAIYHFNVHKNDSARCFPCPALLILSLSLPMMSRID